MTLADEPERGPRDTRLQELVFECLERMEVEGGGALEELCRAHPAEADALRARIEALASVGLLGSSTEVGATTRIGAYTIHEPIGRGGMGIVYRATHVERPGSVALKLVQADLLFASETVRLRFEREIEAIRRLSCEQVVRLVDHGEHEGQPYLVMEYLEGRTLEGALHSLAGRDPSGLHGRDLFVGLGGEVGVAVPAFFDRPWRRVALDLLIEIASAVGHAHECGVIHRDLKPGNVVVDLEGGVKVLDFGLAMLAGQTRLTSTGIPIGSLPYVAPEQLGDGREEPGASCDVYSLGATMYELFALALPFDVDSAPRMIERIVRGAPTPLRERNPAVDAALECVCAKAMDVDARARYQSLGALRDELLRLRDGRPVVARPPSVWSRLRRLRRRRPVASVAWAAGVALMLVSVALWNERERSDVSSQEARAQTALRREQALATVEQLLDLSSGRLEDLPGVGQAARADSVEAAIRVWEPIVEEYPGDRDVLRTFGRLQRAAGLANQTSGDLERASHSFERAIALLAPLVERDPGDIIARLDLAASLHGRATLALLEGRAEAARAATEAAIGHFDELIEREPDGDRLAGQRAIALATDLRCLRKLGRRFEAPRRERADRALEELEPLLETRPQARAGFANLSLELAREALAIGDSERADELVDGIDSLAAKSEAIDEEARARGLTLAKALSSESTLRAAHAMALDLRAMAHHDQADGTDCREGHDRAVELQRALVADYSADLLARRNLVAFLSNRATCPRAPSSEALREDLEEAVALAEVLEPDSIGYRYLSSIRIGVCGNLSQMLLRSDPERALELARAAWDELLEQDDVFESNELERQSGVTLAHAIGNALVLTGRLDEAARFMDAEYEPLTDGHGWYRRLLADCWNEYVLAAAARESSTGGEELAVSLEAGRERFFAKLSDALDAGYADRRELESTPSLECFRGEPRFEQLLARLPL